MAAGSPGRTGTALTHVDVRFGPDQAGVRVHWDSRYDLTDLDGEHVDGQGMLSEGVFTAPDPESAIRRLLANTYAEGGVIEDAALRGLGVRKAATHRH